MRKLLLITTRGLGNIGGVERYLNNFIKYFHHPGFELILLVKRKYSREKGNAHHNIRTMYFDCDFSPYRNFFRFLNPLRALWAIRHGIAAPLKEVRPDLILTSDWEIVLASGFPGTIRIPVCFIPGSLLKMDLMLDYCAEGKWRYRISRWLQNQIKIILEGLAFRASTHILVFSKIFKERIQRHCRICPKKIEVMHMGIELPATPPATAVEKGMILCVGRLVKSKNFHTVIEAMKGLEGFRLSIIGDGPQRKELEDKIQALNLQEQVVLLGKQNNPEVYYKRCEIFIHPSYYENFGLVLLEAMVYGKAPIVLDPAQPGVYTASSELIQDGYNGFFVTNDPIALRERIREVAQLQKHFLAENSRRFAQQFTFSKHLKELTDMMEQMD